MILKKLKIYFILIFMFTLVNNLLSQDKKKKNITGYKELKWGCLIEKVTSVYPKINRIEGEDPDINNSEQWSIKYNEGSIYERIFVFWKKELVKVSVTYKVKNSRERGELVMLFLGEYGWPDNTDEYQNDSNETVIEISWRLGGTEIILKRDPNHISAIHKSIKHFEKVDDDFKPEF